jgi:hypothetical protein
MQQADGVYDRTKPWQSNEERLVSEMLAGTAGMTAEQIANTPRPGFAKQPLFPDRFGYERRALTVQDCFAIETQYGDARNDYSRVTSGTTSSSTPSLPVY